MTPAAQWLVDKRVSAVGIDTFAIRHPKVSPVLSEEEILENARFEESFGVLLASQTKGWMYRLDFCEVCGMIEVWSMRYDPEEVAKHAGEM